MLSLPQIIWLAIKSTSQRFGWWILAFLQFVFSVAFVKSLFVKTNGTALGLLCLFGLSSSLCYLWQDITASYNKKPTKQILRDFFSLVINTALVLLIFFSFALFISRFGLPLATLEVFISLLLSEFIFTLLFIIVFKLRIIDAFFASLDVWKRQFKKTLLVFISCFLLLILCFFLGKQLVFSFFIGEFSVFNLSATIRLFGLASFFVLGFVLAVFNSFWVLLFLNFIKPVKTQDNSEITNLMNVTNPNLNSGS